MSEQLEMKHLIEVAKRETVIAKGLNIDRDSVSLPINVVLQIIKQAEQVEELEAEKDTLSMAHDDMQRELRMLESMDIIKPERESKMKLLSTIHNLRNKEKELRQQNKRYREAMKDAIHEYKTGNQDYSSGVMADVLMGALLESESE